MDLKNFCQSCAMPLTEDMKGTNADGSKNDEYCSYCYKDGQFTAPDITMDEMIDFCVAPMVSSNKGMTEEQAKSQMKEFFPMLKRWK